jgi:hypothetical protein
MGDSEVIMVLVLNDEVTDDDKILLSKAAPFFSIATC